MGLRITTSMLARMSLANLDRQRAQLATTQERAASGLRINRPSDDPAGAAQATTLRAAGEAIQQLLRNGSRARSRLAAGEGALASATDLLIRARELAVQGGNATQDATTRTQIAREIESLHAALVATGNTRWGGAYVFAGFATDAPPFQVSGPFVDVPPTSPGVSYAGDSGEIQVRIEQTASIRVNLDGRAVFLGDADGNGAPDAGREDLFDVLGDLRDALMNDDAAATTAALPRLDRALDQLSSERTAAGALLGRIDSAAERLGSQEVLLSSQLSEVQDADLARVVSDLARQQSALEAGLAAMGRLLPQKLLDFLR